ncbi:hypothetical protein AB205_0205980 [Aquarana catesbeiana]|uniref:CUE domain-containing protein n=1 Tax=Aquarana catesbeiana TaxID=8400 RepID=A0A2G9RQQ4_AQUCT|nr:hypothetical protein AB205_0205980 [Aquarana catesbeiana]
MTVASDSNGKDPKRVLSRNFITYTSPPDACGPALLEEFLERADFITKDLQWLLSLPHDRFWCQVIFDESLQKCLDSYLSNAPRKYDRCTPFPPAVQQVQDKLHHFFFLTFLRMSTHKESKDHHITPSVFGEIIYNNYLFDIPKLLDICILFGKGNSSLLQKMISNIFQQQPSYYQDLDDSIPTLLQVFSSIMNVCGLQQDDCKEPLKLGDEKPTSPLDMTQQHTAGSLEKIVSLQKEVVRNISHSYQQRLSSAHFGTQCRKHSTLCGGILANINTSSSRKTCLGATAAPLPSGVELDSLVSQVKDLLPDLGEGFIIKCLEEYDHNSESVINHLLEDNLSPHLLELDRTMPRQQSVDPCPLVSSRSNVFADDEFDVFSRDVVDTSRIWKGRKKPETAAQVLADKSAILAQKERYSQYSMVSEEHTVDADYDDEYDDTYDGNQIGANDADSDDELISRSFRHDNTASVAGTSRGQGQSRETVQERRKKEANKGARANHNRRTMADRKRNKGMIPS